MADAEARPGSGASPARPRGARRQLPPDRPSITHAFSIGGHRGRVTASCYEDGRPGEVFISMSKEGSTIRGLLGALGSAVSIGLQHGAPLAAYIKHMKHMRFEPDGWTGKLGFAYSIPDYVFRWLELQFGPRRPGPRSRSGRDLRRLRRAADVGAWRGLPGLRRARTFRARAPLRGLA